MTLKQKLKVWLLELEYEINETLRIFAELMKR